MLFVGRPAAKQWVRKKTESSVTSTALKFSNQKIHISSSGGDLRGEKKGGQEVTLLNDAQ